MKKFSSKSTTSWEPVQKWYARLVGEEGHFYHKEIILPGVLRLLDLPTDKSSSLLDLGCGPGILSRVLPLNVQYTGVDASPSLIKESIRLNEREKTRFIVGDITKSLALGKETFSSAAIILALQNVESPLTVFKNAYHFLDKDARFVIVMNHPCFRIPRQSSWGVDQDKKLQYRRLDRYYSPLKIPIHAHPSRGEQSPMTHSFHYPLTSYFQWLKQAGFVVETMEEWCSNKLSTGKNAKMENRSREEFPLFLALVAKKN